MVIMRSVPFPENRGRIIGCSVSGADMRSTDDGWRTEAGGIDGRVGGGRRRRRERAVAAEEEECSAKGGDDTAEEAVA